jgi:alpha-ketoglutaric semialdehyde dehydrogenase
MATFKSISPQAPDDLIGEFAIGEPADVAVITEGARAAQLAWTTIGAAGRAAALAGAAAELRSRREEAVALIIREVGKPVTEARGEVARAVAILDYYAQACFAPGGEQFPPSLHGLLYSERRPHGVAGLITPWNFPLAIPLWKASPALAAGNAVVLKPSPDSAACAQLLGDVMSAHLPPQLFSVIQGDGETGRALVELADVISFTGSAAVGRAVAAAASARGVPVQCEMGGQNAAIVLPDAEPQTAAMIAAAAMGYAGQKCTATRRVIVVGDNEAFVGALAAAVSALEPSPPEDPATVVGPLINEAALRRVEAAIDLAASDGGRFLAGGGRAAGPGFAAPATIVDGLAADHPLAREETFGPFALLLRASDLDEALAISRSVHYGLVTSVHGRDLDALLRAVRDIDTGLIKVNAPTTGVDFYAPFGGEKDSSYGLREQGPGALDFYSSSRTITIAPHGG